MLKCSVNSIESFSVHDGPGIRTVIFFNECHLRCKYCHNPECLTKKENNYTLDQVYNIIMKNKDYFGANGGVTFSGGEPLLHSDFLYELSKKLKKDNINIAIDTSGVVPHIHKELINIVDHILLDIKHTKNIDYMYITGIPINKFELFKEYLIKINKPVSVRQVIVPSIHDNTKYLLSLKEYIQDFNIESIKFLPYHSMAIEKYNKLGIKYEFKDIPSMESIKCNNLYEEYTKI